MDDLDVQALIDESFGFDVVSLKPHRRIIHYYLCDMIAACDRALEPFLLVPGKNRIPYITNQIQYWENVKSGLKWALKVNSQCTD